MITFLKDEILNHKYRVEPRAIKKRPKTHKLLTVPRKQAILKILKDASSHGVEVSNAL